MSLVRHSPIFFLLALAGCCGPAISGRYCDTGQPPPAAACGCGSAPHVSDGCAHGGTGLFQGQGSMLHRPMLAGLFEMGGNGLVPAEQHADYLSPPPKFHPVPTRPVFEPLPTYGGPLLLDAGAVRTHYSP